MTFLCLHQPSFFHSITYPVLTEKRLLIAYKTKKNIRYQIKICKAKEIFWTQRNLSKSYFFSFKEDISNCCIGSKFSFRFGATNSKRNHVDENEKIVEMKSLKHRLSVKA